MYLHDQFSLLGANPVPLRRVETYDSGLNSRSIRVSFFYFSLTLLPLAGTSPFLLKRQCIGVEFLVIHSVPNCTACSAFQGGVATALVN